jgi:hypothetical protein
MFNMSTAFFHGNDNASLSRCIDAFSFPTVLPPTVLGDLSEDTRGDRSTILDAAQTIENAVIITTPRINATVLDSVKTILGIEQAVARGRQTLTLDEYDQFFEAVNSLLSSFSAT